MAPAAPAPPPTTGSPLRAHIGAVTPVVPGPGLPEGLDVDRANNNLDVVDHAGRLWLAWRTAPTHFASAQARLHVVSSDDDGTSWRHEHTLAFGRDVREPRFFVHDDHLFLACFTAGTSGTRFQPDRVRVTRRSDDGAWSEPLAVGPEDTVLWRVRRVGGRLALSVYRHAGTLFTTHPRPLEVECWTSDDGLAWRPFDADRPVIHRGGSESELLELPDGRVALVVRKEGPDGGWGADVGVAPPEAPLHFHLRADARKLDSPLLFLHGDQPVLICRRQVAFGGRYDLGWRRLGPVARTRAYQALYWLTPKRTAVYHLDPDRLALHHLTDLPSAGDTAFAGQVPRGGGRHLVFNYSSPVDRTWWPWTLGQLRPTHIDAVDLTLS